ncbi:MAG TPA: hypothetical protein VIU11_23575 [Nakamurella sp.]
MSHPNSPLSIADRWTLPLGEASALCVRRSSDGDPEILCVDDAKFRVARVAIAGDDLAPRAQADKVKKAFADRRLPTKKSNFEGIASDASRRIYLVQENDQRVTVLAPDLATVDRVIDLHVDPRDVDLAPQWLGEKNSNSRGEGLLLLRHGHLLVAKQKGDPWLIEFGPAGHEPIGVRPGKTTVPPDGSFDPPQTDARYEVLAKWLVTDPRITSLNDLALSESGHLCVTSSASGCLARLPDDLVPGQPAGPFDVWELPGTVTRGKAEGLVRWPGHGWLVAVDFDEQGDDLPNLFLLGGGPA